MDLEVIKAFASPTTANFLFIATQATQLIINYLNRQKEIERILIGLYREIADNLVQNKNTQLSPELVIAIKESIDEDQKEADKAGKNPSYRPFVAITESNRFHDAIASSLPMIQSESLIATSAYYRSVFDQVLIAKGIDGPSFHSISPQSRKELIDELAQALSDSASKGEMALKAIERRYGLAPFASLRFEILDLYDISNRHSQTPDYHKAPWLR